MKGILPGLRTAVCLLYISRSYGWSSLYSPSLSVVHLDDGSVLSLNTSNFVGRDSIGDVENSFSWLSSPPPSSQLAVDSAGQLFAFDGDQDSCQNSPIQVSWYDYSSQTWETLTSSPPNYYLANSTIWTSKDIVYIFGGYCPDSTNVYNTLYAFNTSSLSFFEPPNANPPRALSSAGVAQIENDTFLIIGGAAGSSGWIDLQQVAIWQFGSWTFRSASNSTNIDARTNPLVVPIFGGSDDSIATQAIVIGGSVDNRAAQPYVASLSLDNSQAWTWSSIDFAGSPVNGALSINGTFVTITLDSPGTGNSKRSSLFSKSIHSSSNFTISLYDPSNWKSVQSLVVGKATPAEETSTAGEPSSSGTSTPATPTPLPSSKSLSTGGIAALSTILPLSIAGIAAASFILIRKKRKQPSSFSKGSRLISPVPSLSHHFTGPYPRDSASIASWNEKRERLGYEFDGGQDDEDPLQGRDVQVLVSSQRRSRLRVANPDMEDEAASDVMSRTSSVLGRNPSSRKSSIHMHKRNKSDLSTADSERARVVSGYNSRAV